MEGGWNGCDPARKWVTTFSLAVGSSLQDVLEIVFDRDLSDGDDVLTSLLLSYTDMREQVSKSTSQQGFESLLDQSFRGKISSTSSSWKDLLNQFQLLAELPEEEEEEEE